VSLDDRIGTIAGPKQIAKVRLLRSDRIDCASIYDIHPIKNSHYMVVVTFENDLFLYDLKSSQVLKHLEPMRYAPATALVLQGLSTNEHTENTELRRLNLVAFGYAFNLNPNRGSEFDPSVYIYNISTGKRIQTLPGHERCVKYLI
jgi:WD40 repeat protein